MNRNTIARILVGIISIQVMSGAMNIVAYEIGKVQLAETKGKHYKKNIFSDMVNLNEEPSPHNDNSTIKKNPILDVKGNEYDPSSEVLSKRTSNSKTYKLYDGSYVTDTYFEPIHKLEDQEYINIDNTISNTSQTRSNPIYENKNGIYEFKVEHQNMSITNSKDDTLSFIHQGQNLDNYSAKENVILYSEVYNNIDMEYRLNGNAVTTNFYINGKSNQEEISYQIDKGTLEVKEEQDVLLFINSNKQVEFSYQKPVLQNNEGKTVGTTMYYEGNSDILNVVVRFDENWLQDENRIFPYVLSSKTSDESTQLNVTSSYNRSLEPNTTSRYSDLFVGYEDGQIAGLTYPLGITRTYIHVGGLSIGNDKEIIDAKLKLYKRISDPNQCNTISIGKSESYRNPDTITWANKPSVSNISNTSVRSDSGWQEFDVKSYIEDVYSGKNNTIELKASDERDLYTPNVFFSESGVADGMPKITIQYRDAFDINPDLPLNTFDTEMRLFSVLNKGFEAFSFDGIAKPNAQMVFELVEKGKNSVVRSETSKGNISKYLIDPIYITNYLENTQIYEKNDINYTTDYIYKETIPEFDKPYEYKVKAKINDATSTTAFRTDSFIKYKVKTGDNLKNLATYYGLKIDEIKADNNLITNIIQEDDILLLRFKKDNDKVSKDIYTPPVRTIEYKSIYVDRGARCSSGSCEIIDPVNATTGNYFHESKDFIIKDAIEFNFLRYYNSTGPQLSNMFGNGFTTPIESYISYDKKGNILYFAGDGKIFEFKKRGSSYESRPQDNLSVNYNDEKVTIKDIETEITYQFDIYGYLESMISKEGVTSTILYDDYGMITSVKVANKIISFEYNDRKLVQSITLPNGKSVRYGYDENRNLIEFIDTKGNVESYTYDNHNFLVAIKDKNENLVTQNTYDDEGRVVKQIDGNENISKISYYNDHTVIKNADGREDIYTFNKEYDITSISQNGQITSQNIYDTNRNITSSTSIDGKVTRYSYNNRNNLVSAEYFDGSSVEYRYDTNDNVIYLKDREGHITQNTYIGNDLQSTTKDMNASVNYKYDSERRVIEESDQFGVSKTYTYEGNMVSSIIHSNGLIEFFEYDEVGNITKESDNQGKVITYIYSPNNEIIQKNYSDGSNEQWEYDNNGNILNYKDRIGGVTKNVYDKNNNQIHSTVGNLTTHKSYNQLNQLVSETDAQGLTKSYTYDILGNKSTECDKYGNVTSYEYDGEGNTTKTIDAFGNEETNDYINGNLMKKITKDGLVTNYEYDSFNREIKKTNSNGTIETKEYEGLHLHMEVDEKGTVTTHEYDIYEREIKTIKTYSDGVISVNENKYDVYGNIVESINDGIITKFEYDIFQRLVTTMDTLGFTTRKEYDIDGNIIKETDALGNETITQFDANKNITSKTDKNGNTETKMYNASGQLISEKDALGYVKTYVYNKKGQLESIQDPYKRTISYKYDTFGNQIETIIEGKVIEKKLYDTYGREVCVDSLNKKTSTSYDDFSRKVKITNELTGLSTFLKYDIHGNVIEEKDTEGLTIAYEFDKYNRVIKTTDVEGRVEELTYDIRDHILRKKSFDGSIVSSSYDKKGNVVESKDMLGKITKNTYDLLNRLVKEETGYKTIETVYDANGQIIEIKNLNNKTSTRNVYDKNGNIIQSVDALGNINKSAFDGKNQIISLTDANENTSYKEYDAYGNVVKEIDALGNIKQKKYNVYGLIEIEVDERGFQIDYEYNDDLQLIKVMDSTKSTVEIEYNDALQKTKEINANHGVSTFEYDIYGNVIKQTAPSGKVTTTEYDKLGNVIKEKSGNSIIINTYDKRGRLTEISLNNIKQQVNKYNKFNQIIKSSDANGNISRYKYNSNGDIIYENIKGFISEKKYDNEGNLIKQIDNKTYITENCYDANNRLIETKINDKSVMLKKYDALGNEKEVTKNGILQKISYDANSQVIRIEIPSKTNKDSFVTIQRIEYDEVGNALKIYDAYENMEEKMYDAHNNIIKEVNKNGIENTFEYDGMNNLVKAQNHEERYVSYAYDKANNMIGKNINNKLAKYEYDIDNQLIKEENEYGYVTRYTYDLFGNKIKAQTPDDNIIHYTYDKLGNLLSENGNTYEYDQRNNIIFSSNEVGTIKNTYDAFNNKTSVIDSRGDKVIYTYNADNLLYKKKYSDIDVSYSYNDFGQIKTISKNDELIAEYEFDSRNEVIKVKQKDTISEKSYDDMGRLLNQRTIRGDNEIVRSDYFYDANDNLIKEVIDGKENTYAYNGFDELIQSHKYIDGKIEKTIYGHDLYGNKTSQSDSEGRKVYHYNEKNQIEFIKTDNGNIKYSYDENGNVSKKINQDGREDNYTYNDFNQLIKLQQGQYIYDYTYDAEKERIQQIKTDTNDYHYDVWYTYSTPEKVVSDIALENSFDELKEQVKKKALLNNDCTITQKNSYDVSYFKEKQVTNYTLDRNMEYTSILRENNIVNVYGETLVQSGETNIITGWNSSVIAKVENNDVKKISYSDYGITNDIGSGHGYNGEYKDDSGLIYLRARYYDPEIARFTQLDDNYDGEKESIVTQNKYAYTLNNPYKYVDRDGNISWGEMTYGSDYYNNLYGNASKKTTPKKNSKKTSNAQAKTRPKAAIKTSPQVPLASALQPVGVPLLWQYQQMYFSPSALSYKKPVLSFGTPNVPVFKKKCAANNKVS